MKPPKKIWLQWNAPDVDEDYGKTWCIDKINDDDIEYHLAPQWVSVEDRLPEVKKTVVVFRNQHNDYSLAYMKTRTRLPELTEEKYWIIPAFVGELYSEIDFHVTHWMPLPAPPEDE